MTTGATGPSGPATKTFYVKSRRTSPILYTTVEASTRDDAIHQMILSCPPGDEIEVLQAEETPYVEMEGMTGASGTTGGTGPTGTAHRK
jgi:hypothetical protein